MASRQDKSLESGDPPTIYENTNGGITLARPRLELGTWGKITLTPQVQRDGAWATAPDGTKPERYRARAAVRDLDGKTRDVERYAPTKTRAEAVLKKALRDRTVPRQGNALKAEMGLVPAGEFWLEQAKRPESGLSENTRKQYEGNFDRYIRKSNIAGLTLREVNSVPIIRPFLQTVADNHGSGAAKTAKSVLSGILTLAVNDGVLEVNAARQLRPPKSAKPKPKRRDHTRALTREERTELLAFADADQKAIDRDMADFLHWMAGMGTRISEAIDQLDKDIEIRKIKQDDGAAEKVGRAMVPGTKSANSVDRWVTMPDWLVERIERRWKERGKTASGYTFPSVRSGLRRDLRNTEKHVRDVFDRAGFEWAISHTFRRTVATDIDKAGLGASEAAAVLGNDPLTTARFYFGRKGDTSRAAKVL